MVKPAASCVLTSCRPSTVRRSSSEAGSTVGDFPLAKIHTKGERPTQSVVCTSSACHLLRPCWSVRVTILGILGTVLLTGLSGCLSPIARHRAVMEYDRTVSYVEADLLLLNIARA